MPSGWDHFRDTHLGMLGLGAVNLALTSIYFTPVWGRDAVRVLISPYHGLEQPGHAAAALLVRDFLDLGWPGLITVSHMLAGIKLMMAAAFLAYGIEFARALVTGRPLDRQTTDVVLILASLGVVIGVVPSMALGETAMLRLAVTEMILVTGASIVIIAERRAGIAVRSMPDRRAQHPLMRPLAQPPLARS